MPGDITTRRRALSPAQLIALSFVGAIAVGSVLLALPQSHAPGTSVGLLDALFTATSAVCVTGLVVVDTGSDFSRFGQVIILVLFQFGGLGILTLGTILTLATGSRIGYADRIRVQQQVGATDTGSVLELVRNIVGLVAVVEAVGAVLLYPRFAAVEGAWDGAFHALFHSVSAFNNAGFSLNPDSLSGYVGSPLVNVSVVMLILFGAMGFTVLVDVRGWIGAGPSRHLSLHSKMALTITSVLVLAGTVVVLVLESGNPDTLGPLSFLDRVQASLFQGVTPRTAGFNTLDYGAMNTPTLVFTMLLMFIGGNPGSTSGGVKTLTVYVLVVGLIGVARQQRDYTVYGRRLSTATILRAGVLVFGALMLIGAVLTLLTISEPDIPFLDLAFETISAFGTVGLSMGATADLSSFGKLVVVFLMYLGRVGLLTFALALTHEHQARGVRYPSEEVVIG